MGTILELCTCHASDTVIPNYKSLIDKEDDALNNNKNEVNNDQNNEVSNEEID